MSYTKIYTRRKGNSLVEFSKISKSHESKIKVTRKYVLKGRVCIFLYQTTYVIECHAIDVLTQGVVLRIMEGELHVCRRPCRHENLSLMEHSYDNEHFYPSPLNCQCMCVQCGCAAAELRCYHVRHY